MQLMQLEAHERDAKERAEFKKWWMKQQRKQLKQLSDQSAAGSSFKGKNVPGKTLTKSSQPSIVEPILSVNATAEEQIGSAMEATETPPDNAQKLTDASDEPGPSNASTLTRFLRTMTRDQIL